MSNEFPVHDEIELVAKHEETLGRLYDTYSSIFPEHREFWIGIADEESGHAAWVRGFRSRCMEGSCKVKEGRFRIKAIESSMNFMNKQMQAALSGSVNILTAAATASDIEHALLDKDFFEVYDTDDEDLKNTLDFLRLETEKHARKVADFLVMVRQSGDTAIG